jgi:23S rRNA (uridine2552-2'-O)-methyltransferase
MTYNPKDHYFKKAKLENFAARSVYKLQEIDTKFKILKPGNLVLDLGAAPGSWSQYAGQKVGNSGKILGIDLTEITIKVPQAKFVQADLRDLSLADIFAEHGFTEQFHLVMSDMAPNTTGIRLTDQARSTELCEIALDVAAKFVKPGGNFVCKFFHSGDFKELQTKIKAIFQKVETVKPDSTRSISKEIFFVGLNRK